MFKSLISHLFYYLPLELRVKGYFFYRHRYFLRLKNPKNFSEKINYRKLHPQPIYSILADKYSVRDYVKENIGDRYLIPLKCVLEESELKMLPHIDTDSVAKTTHGSGPDNLEFLPSKLEPDLLINKFKVALNSKFRGVRLGELHYDEIPRKVVVEERLGGEIAPVDYKFHVFENKGSPQWFLQVDAGRFSKHIRNYYDSDLNRLDLEMLYPNGVVELPDISKVREMASLAISLVKNLSYARIDFYLVDGEIYFGEITLTPGSGFERFSNIEYDKLWGELWN